jgi:hypothetical protein
MVIGFADPLSGEIKSIFSMGDFEIPLSLQE